MKAAILLTCLFAGNLVSLSTSSVNKTSVTNKKVASKRLTFSSKPYAPVSVTIDKTEYELHVYDSKGWYATYPVVFGNNTLADKKMEGDKLTPEGSFRIVNKRVHDKWHRYMGLDYPTKESLYKFNERKKKGEVPAKATPGGGIGIHGVWPNEDFVIDRYKNWTNGCIALKNGDISELYGYLPIGTLVTIKK